MKQVSSNCYCTAVGLYFSDKSKLTRRSTSCHDWRLFSLTFSQESKNVNGYHNVYCSLPLSQSFNGMIQGRGPGPSPFISPFLMFDTCPTLGNFLFWPPWESPPLVVVTPILRHVHADKQGHCCGMSCTSLLQIAAAVVFHISRTFFASFQFFFVPFISLFFFSLSFFRLFPFIFWGHDSCRNWEL